MSYIYPSVPSTPSVFTYPTYTYTTNDPDAERMRFALELIAGGDFLSDEAKAIAAKALREDVLVNDACDECCDECCGDSVSE